MQKFKKSCSIYYGVTFYRHSNKFAARIKRKNIKCFKLFNNELEAALYYDEFVKKNNLPNRLNFPLEENNIPNTKAIYLTQGKFAIVDDKNFEEINKYKWYAFKHGNTFYAVSSSHSKDIPNYMHQFILPLAEKIDHINRNGLHNYESNLRICNSNQNGINSQKSKNKSSKYKGVYFHKSENKYMARIMVNGHRLYLGSFKSEEEAAKIYDENAIKYFKEFAFLNFDE